MIPTIILTGFLGAGKTTLLNRLIEFYHDKKTILLINEFGKVGVDGEIIVQGDYEKVELNKGSLFCICVRTDFITEVEKIATQLKPELLLIEATGLADTSEMEKMLNLPNLKKYIDLKMCICLVDCQNFLKISKYLKAPISQVKHADLVLLNKVDTVDDNQLEKIKHAVHEISPTIPIFETQCAEFPLEILEQTHRTPLDTQELPGEGRPDAVYSVTLTDEVNFSSKSWERFKDSLDSKILRVKGFVSIENIIHYVDATTESWKQTAIEVHPQKSRLIIIGETIDEEKVKQKFTELSEKQ